MINYDPALVRSFADKLYAQANAAVRSQMILGALIGIVGGLWAGGSLFEYKNAIGSLVGAILAASVGTLVGLMSGRQRAILLRVQAQTALCQLEIEEHTRPAQAP